VFALPLGCATLLGYHLEDHPDDDEDPDIVAVSATACADAEVHEVDGLFADAYELAEDAPVGERIALQGHPTGSLSCTQKGCSFECCDNSCGADPDCAYLLRAEDPALADYAYICLASDDFDCGGTDCSSWCTPFSKDPEHDYRFIGVLEDDTGLPTLRVETYCRVE
jgi:hypothetical protein